MFGEYAIRHCKHPDLRLQVNAANGKFKHTNFYSNILMIIFHNFPSFRDEHKKWYILPLLLLSVSGSVLDYSDPEDSGSKLLRKSGDRSQVSLLPQHWCKNLTSLFLLHNVTIVNRRTCRNHETHFTHKNTDACKFTVIIAAVTGTVVRTRSIIYVIGFE